MFAGVLLPSTKEAQAHLTEAGDARVLDASLLRNEADISPEIQLRIITNKIKKDEAEGTSKKKKDTASHDKNPIIERGKLPEKFDQQEYSVKSNNKCDVAEGTCQFAQVKDFVAFMHIFFCICFNCIVFLS